MLLNFEEIEEKVVPAAEFLERLQQEIRQL